MIAPARRGKVAEEQQKSGFWSGAEEGGRGGGGVDLLTGKRGRRGTLVFREGAMPGCAVLLLLLFLVVLPTGSDARRIRKRGLNHKVRMEDRD